MNDCRLVFFAIVFLNRKEFEWDLAKLAIGYEQGLGLFLIKKIIIFFWKQKFHVRFWIPTQKFLEGYSWFQAAWKSAISCNSTGRLQYNEIKHSKTSVGFIKDIAECGI